MGKFAPFFPLLLLGTCLSLVYFEMASAQPNVYFNKLPSKSLPRIGRRSEGPSGPRTWIDSSNYAPDRSDGIDFSGYNKDTAGSSSWQDGGGEAAAPSGGNYFDDPQAQFRPRFLSPKFHLQ